MSIVYLVLGIVLLIFGGNFLVKSSVSISLKFNYSKAVIGMTVVSFATSAPELIVSFISAHKGHSDIALGNVIGSNIANISLVLGITALVSPIIVGKIFYKINWAVLMIISVLFYFFAASGMVLSRVEGGALFIFLIIFLIYLVKNAKKIGTENDDIDDNLKEESNLKIIAWFVIGGLFLWLGSELLINSAIKLATHFGVTERIISVSVVAVGTSIPELSASIIASLKKEKAISLGNLVGSNIFNIGSVLGITSLIQPIHVLNKNLISQDMLWMLFTAFMLMPFVFLPTKYKITRLKGLIILLIYCIYIYTIF